MIYLQENKEENLPRGRYSTSTSLTFFIVTDPQKNNISFVGTWNIMGSKALDDQVHC